MHSVLRFVPKNFLSWCVGEIARVKLPQALALLVITAFAKKYRVRVEEAELPLNCYHSLAHFFSRRLKAGLRPVGSGVVSPVDGVCTVRGKIENGTLLQIKGINYTVQELLGEERSNYEGGTYLTIYLSPPDYHRIHSPVAGNVVSYKYLPGALWPVNDWAVRNIRGVFARNERVAIELETANSKVTLVAVGALNVGSVSLSFATFVSNRPGRRVGFQTVLPTPIEVEAGGELATFNLGSTVILLFPPNSVVLSLVEGIRIKCGESIGEFR